MGNIGSNERRDVRRAAYTKMRVVVDVCSYIHVYGIKK
jgi:hypothetical protein